MLGGQRHQPPAPELAAEALPQGGDAVDDGGYGDQGQAPVGQAGGPVRRLGLGARRSGPRPPPRPRRWLRTFDLWGTLNIT